MSENNKKCQMVGGFNHTNASPKKKQESISFQFQPLFYTQARRPAAHAMPSWAPGKRQRYAYNIYIPFPFNMVGLVILHQRRFVVTRSRERVGAPAVTREATAVATAVATTVASTAETATTAITVTTTETATAETTTISTAAEATTATVSVAVAATAARRSTLL